MMWKLNKPRNKQQLANLSAPPRRRQRNSEASERAVAESSRRLLASGAGQNLSFDWLSNFFYPLSRASKTVWGRAFLIQLRLTDISLSTVLSFSLIVCMSCVSSHQPAIPTLIHQFYFGLSFALIHTRKASPPKSFACASFSLCVCMCIDTIFSSSPFHTLSLLLSCSTMLCPFLCIFLPS